MEITIGDFISLLRTDQYIEAIYLCGGCYKLYKLLVEFYPTARPYISHEEDHVITELEGKYYDITGEVDGADFSAMTEVDRAAAEGWSFGASMVLQVAECPCCGGPIVV